MRRLFKNYRLHEYTEALFLLTLGIIIQVLDGSPLDLKQRWTLAWETDFPREYFSVFIQQIIKTALSVIILVRCLTTVLYVLFGIFVIYCILKESSPKLMLPWLFISGLKSVGLTLVETLIGVFVCSRFGTVRKACIEFVLSKAIELFFAIYLWACIRSVHKDLERYEDDIKEEQLLTAMVIHRTNLRRRRARSMIDATTLYKTANLNYFELKDVPNIIFEMLKSEDELSQDSLLSPGMMLASVSNMGSYDYLKTSLSLGELGIMDLDSIQVLGLDDNRNLPLRARAMEFLRITWDDVHQARERRKKKSFLESYSVPERISKRVLDAKPSALFARRTRQDEVLLATLPEPDREKLDMSKRKTYSKQQDGHVDGYNKSRFEAASEESSKTSFEEILDVEDNGEEDDQTYVSYRAIDGETLPDLWFMTNRKDEVNRIGLFVTGNAKRADNYERLYRQDFMSTIGPEVFDKASKLVKLTSLSDLFERENRSSTETPDSYANIIQTVESDEEIPEISESNKGSKPKKRIAFEDHHDGHTAMPVSVIVTNFPIELDSQLSKYGAVYFKETVSSNTEITLTKCSHEANLESYVQCKETCEIRSKNEGTSVKRQCFLDGYQESKDNGQAVNLFMLKCSPGATSNLLHDGESFHSLKEANLHKDLSLYKHRELSNLLMTLLKPDIILQDSVHDNVGEDEDFIGPRVSEQILFVKDLIRKPLKDVLKTYYDLRELDNLYSELLQSKIFSNESIGKDRKHMKTSEVDRTLEEKQKVDTETQVCFGIHGSGSFIDTETIEFGNSKSEKVEASGNETPHTHNLFANKHGRSSDMDVNLKNELKDKSYVDISNREGETCTKSCLESLKENTELVSENDCHLVLSPQRTVDSLNESFYLAQTTESHNELSKTETISLPDTYEDDPSIYSGDSDESFSLFYSKTADLASPLLDMKRFIYPDHIHYSYKNVKKKGFDVELNGGLPLLVRDSLTLNSSITLKKIDTPPDPQTGVTRRPMDLTFAGLFDGTPQRDNASSADKKENNVNCNDSHHIKVPLLPEELSTSNRLHQKKEKKWLKKFAKGERGLKSNTRCPFELTNMSSANLHSNKGRVDDLNNPVVAIENKLNKKYKRLN